VELSPWGIQVVLIEPGSIATPIWDKGVAAAKQAREEIPPEALERYGEAMDKTEKLAVATGRRGIAPEKVAAKVAHALTSSRPHPRYTVGPDAKIQSVANALLPDRTRDRLFRRLLGIRKQQ
jgi:NAD(P)-dependent dehydrogenase (short-subunit alcohol dehydrogenase family)